MPNINFRSGLNQAQRTSITNLYNNKPTEQWTSTDWANWNYATNNSTPPARENTSRTTPSNTPRTPTGSNQQYGGMPANLVSKLQQAFGRVPNATDIANWRYNSTVFERQLDQAIGQRSSSSSNQNTNRNTAQPQNQPQDLETQLISEIDKMNLTSGEKAVLKELVYGDYTSGQKIPSEQEIQQMIRDAATNAEADISPYYETLTTRELDDLKTQLSGIRGGFERYQEKEGVDYKSKLKQTKDNLRARGLTFSGASRATLGSEGALASEGIEGALPEQRRLDYQENLSSYQNKARDLGTKAERYLGSNRLSGVNFGTYNTPYGQTSFYNPRGNVATGDVDLEKLAAIEQSKWNRLQNQSLFYFN